MLGELAFCPGGKWIERMQDKPKRDQTRKRGGQISGVQVMFAAILSIGLILAINFSGRIRDGQPLQEAYNLVRKEIAQLQEDQATLTAQRNYVMSDAYVESWAHDDGKMVRNGEVLVIPVPSGAEVNVTPTPAVPINEVQTSPEQAPTWNLWWQLFFDSPPPKAP